MSDDQDHLAGRFELHRPRLRGIATQMLGSASAADDAVQTTWLRLTSGDSGEPDNLGGWLTTVVSRVAIDMLRAGQVRDHDALDDHPELATAQPDPGQAAEVADSVGDALRVVLDTLSPSERLVLVLKDSFDLPHEEIAVILGRSTTATKQLAYRARAKVRANGNQGSTSSVGEHRGVVDAFLAASRSGDLTELVALLDPDVDLTADARAVAMGSDQIVQGAEAVGRIFSGRAQGAQPAAVDGAIGIAWAVGDAVRVVWDLSIGADGRISHLDMLADPDTIGRLELELL